MNSLKGLKNQMIVGKVENVPKKELMLQINLKDRAMSYAKIQLTRSAYVTPPFKVDY